MPNKIPIGKPITKAQKLYVALPHRILGWICKTFKS